MGFVLLAALRDLVWRARRWAIATLGTALALALTLLLSGFLASFDHEIEASLDALGAEGYLVRAGSAGPFTTPAPIGADRAAELAALEGVGAVAPLVSLPYTLRHDVDGDPIDVFLLGMDPGGPARWPIREGRAPEVSGEVVLDARAGADLGDVVTMGSRPFRVVGTTRDVHVLAGKAMAWTSVADAQGLLFDGAPVLSGFLAEGRPAVVPDDLAFVDRAAAEADLIRLVQPVVESIETFRALMWLVAAAVVGSVLYLTAVDRVRDFAVFKATGVRDRDLAASLLVQAALLAVVASGLAMLIAVVLAPTFPTPVRLTPTLFMLAPAVALVIGAVGSLAGVRRAMAVDPALAFGGS